MEQLPGSRRKGTTQIGDATGVWGCRAIGKAVALRAPNLELILLAFYTGRSDLDLKPRHLGDGVQRIVGSRLSSALLVSGLDSPDVAAKKRVRKPLPSREQCKPPSSSDQGDSTPPRTCPRYLLLALVVNTTQELSVAFWGGCGGEQKWKKFQIMEQVNYDGVPKM